MRKREDRFVKVYAENDFTENYMAIYVDKKTGVNYLFSCYGNAGGLTPLLDSTGKPVITSVSELREEE